MFKRFYLLPGNRALLPGRYRIKIICLVACLQVSVSSFSQSDNIQIKTLVDAENNFARTALEKNVKAAFEANLNDSSVVFERGGVIANGKESVKKWEADDSSYLFWWPVVADIASSGELGYTTGPCEWGKWGAGKANPKITGGGYYATVWKKDQAGQWKIATDLGTGVFDTADKKLQLKFNTTHQTETSKKINYVKAKEELLTIDRNYNDKLNAERKSFFTEYLSPEARLHRSGERPFTTPESIRQNITIEKDVKFNFEQAGGGMALSADMAYTYGKAGFELVQEGKEYKVSANYLRVWKMENGKWKIVLDVVSG